MSPTMNSNDSTASFHEISQINENLFLSAAHVINQDSVKKRGISLIINATIEEPSLNLKNCDYVKIRISDHPSSRLDVFFDLVADKIKANKDKLGKTLVHCVAGVSRSVSLCLAYLVKYERMNLRSAFKLVKGARPIARPNWGFWRQLIDYELRLTGTTSVRLVESKGAGEEPLPDVYGPVAEVKENSAHHGDPVPVRSFFVPKYYARRSRSEHSMIPHRDQATSSAPPGTPSSVKPTADCFAEKYRPTYRTGFVQINDGPISKTTTITFGPQRSLAHQSSATTLGSLPTSSAFQEWRSKLIVPLRSPCRAFY